MNNKNIPTEQRSPSLRWYYRNREAQLKRARQWQADHKDYIRWKYIEKTYGLTRDEYILLLRQQDSSCAICGAKEKLDVDHIHGTEIIRGLLCRDCNTGIGKLGDSPDTLRAAIGYLEDRGFAAQYGQKEEPKAA